MMHEVKQPLRLVGGKFMRGDIEEAPEIGNSEQIALLQQIEREASEREQQARDGNLDVEISVENIRYDAVGCAPVAEVLQYNPRPMPAERVEANARLLAAAPGSSRY